VTATHAPVPVVQVMHVPEHAPEQHVPSSQTPEAHCELVVHALPAPTSGTHLLEALQ
jgi:hypothetical protein